MQDHFVMSSLYHFPMNYLSKLKFINLVIDITLLVAAEFLTRCIFSSSLGNAMDSSMKQINLFVVQGAILMFSSLTVYVLHHTPYFLICITTFIIIRLLVLVYNRHRHNKVYSDNYVSQPIRLPSCQWLGKSRVMQTTSEFNNLSLTQMLHHSTPTIEENQAASLEQHSTTYMSKHSLNPEKRKSNGNRREMSQMQPLSLHRSPMPSLSTVSSPSDTEVGRASTASQSFLKYNFGYFSSLFSKKQSSAIPAGIYNLGNTCFINSTLQCLIWTKGFTESLPYIYATQVYNENTRLVKLLDDVVILCHGFTDSDGVCQPVNVTKLLQSISRIVPELVSTPTSDTCQSQQDAAEFLLWLLNYLHNIIRAQSGGKSGLEFVLSDTNISDLKKSKQLCLNMLERSKSTDIPSLREPLTNLSEVDWQLHWQEDSSSLYKLFLGQIIEARECQRCGRMSFSVEYFTVLPLSLPIAIDRQCTLQECLKLFSCPEDMTHSNMITCSCVNGIEGTLAPGKRLSLLSRPSKRLIIQLTRYSYNSECSMAMKSTISVLVPTSFDVLPHTMSSIIGNNTDEQTAIYELQGICVHSGAQSTSFGHYVAFCKVSTGKWYYFNDDNVSLVDNIEAELKTVFVLENAYLLFYSLKDN